MDSRLELSFEDLCDRYEECYVQHPQAIEALMAFEGVVGVGVGPKERGRRLSPEQPCLVVYVNEKRPGSALDARQLVPLEFGGVPTDVVEVGSRFIDVHNELDSRWIANSQVSGTFINNSVSANSFSL